MKVELIGKSFLKDSLKSYEECDTSVDQMFESEEVKRDLKIMAGKAAGICYMGDNYLSDGIQNVDKATARANNTAKSGHYSTYEHGSVNLLIETNKMMAMVLNSMGLYCTSEKSARYTAMKPNTEIEEHMYSKWKGIFANLIGAYHVNFDDKQIEKLAMENARYMLSVFTPTVMEYSVPYNRLILMHGWLNDLRAKIINLISKCTGGKSINPKDYKRETQINFLLQLHDSVENLYNAFSKLNITKEDNKPILSDHKNMEIDLFTFLSRDVYENIYTADAAFIAKYDREDPIGCYNNIGGNIYEMGYFASFAELAQAQRHRTLHYSINNIAFERCYIPKIIRNTPYEEEWIEDFKELVSKGVVPQATLLKIQESGLIKNFILKAKERLCLRAQLEICDITVEQVKIFYKNKYGINPSYEKYFNSLVNILDINPTGLSKKYNSPDYDSYNVKPRCFMNDYVCKEACGRACINCLKDRIV